MQTIVFSQYGPPDVLEIGEVETPTPKEGEVLVQVHAASLNSWDEDLLRGDVANRLIFGLRKPKVKTLGADIAGRVKAVGKNVTSFRPGDEVWGDLSESGWGGLAEYVCAPETALALKPVHMTFAEAAAVPQAGLLALQGLGSLGDLRPGQTVLINGAGGGVGTYALQIAKHAGADVTAVDSAGKLAMLRTLGADHVVDYRQADFTKLGRRYDLILDVRTNRSVFHYTAALKPNGAYITVGGAISRLLQTFLLGPWIKKTQGKHMRVLAYKPNQGLETLKELIDAGHVKSVIDGPYRFSEVPDAFKHLNGGEHLGKIVISIRS